MPESARYTPGNQFAVAAALTVVLARLKVSL
jgi:hypothetical protein